MNWWQKPFVVCRALFRKCELDAEMNEEMRSHIEMQTQESIESGMMPEEARRAALRQFGWAESIKETCREQRGVLWVENLWRDFRYAVRMLVKTPGFTAVAVGTLALCIGVNLGLFTLLDAQFWRPRPVLRPEEIWSIFPSDHSGTPKFFNLSRRYYDAVCKYNQAFKEITGGASCSAKLWTPEGWEHVEGGIVSANYFSFCGVQPILGRGVLPEKDKPDVCRVVVISFRLWQEYFHGDPSVLSKPVNLDDCILEVVGVAPPGFKGVGLFEPDFLIPLGLQKLFSPFALFGLRGRLKEGITPPQAAALLSPIVEQVTASLHPIKYTIDNVPVGASNNSEFTGVALLRAGYGSVGRQFAYLRRSELIKVNSLAGMVTLLALLIGAFNLASLLWARAVARRREMATRIALGAPRSALVRQLTLEGVLIAALGSGAALLILTFFTTLAPTLMAAAVFDPDSAASLFRPDLRVTGFAVMIALLVGVLFSLGPAISATRFNPYETLKESQAGIGRAGHCWPIRRVLVVAQVAGSLVLLSGACLCLQAISKQLRLDVGFRPEPLIVAQINLEKARYTLENALTGSEELRRRLSAIPGVESVGMMDSLPFSARGQLLTLHLEGHEGIKLGYKTFYVGPEYFGTMGIPLTAGGEIQTGDFNAGRPLALVNESFVRRFWPDQQVVGKQVDGSRNKYRVIGVVRDARLESPSEEPQPTVFFCAPAFHALRPTFILRTSSHPEALLKPVRDELIRVHPRLGGSQVCTMRQAMRAPFAPQRKAMNLLGELAAVALGLSMLGTYGMMSYLVAGRTREIGIRLAVGAQRADVAKLVLKFGIWLGVVGISVGLPLSFCEALFLRNSVIGVSPFDLQAFLMPAGAVLLAIILACAIPLLRATRIDPMLALRCE
jgi:predicted permease